MTTTTVINGVTVGSTAARISNVTKQAITASVINLQTLLVPGTSYPDSSRVKVWFATSPDSLTANVTTAELLAGMADWIEITKPYMQSTPVVPVGAYLYVWVEEPKLATAATLTVKVTEY